MCGTPVVASARPGVRAVIRTTGMGELAQPGDAEALGAAIGRVLDNAQGYFRPRSEIERTYDLARTVEQYEELFAALVPAPARDQVAAHDSA